MTGRLSIVDDRIFQNQPLSGGRNLVRRTNFRSKNGKQRRTVLNVLQLVARGRKRALRMEGQFCKST